ncbi:MAG: uncharacterized protein PWP49_528 [Thermococcaceae archaeon]|jgi:hypothetical protein|uniref:DUF167 domain-containing protein n=1 Tax=Thermococcus TaxID=2263 RepID=UPI0005B2C14A|nr:MULTISPECIES: DUF167 domain-containing protein [Thermococcus]KUJ98942.1 MAG: hypothetical protein XD43_1397 [Thermococcales archaeon 44_46]MDK2784027.1 uncharacterized protein [Thermococcaceae archaeon]MCA6214516.1 YggU family protein [Thermococcus bergensis]MDK2854375.1 uncharacterized protein [Thermococcaceae archaeon]MDK2984316.1 uncharacterized protein [Thermococcaceae archaeon]
MIKESKDGVVIQIYVQPNAKKTEIEGIDEWRKRLKVRVKAPPVEGKANKEVVKFFSKLLGAEVIIIRGETSREKDLLVKGLSLEEVKRKLGI